MHPFHYVLKSMRQERLINHLLRLQWALRWSLVILTLYTILTLPILLHKAGLYN